MIKNIEEKINTLDRIIGWVENCDSKSSIMLALVGVLISMLFTSDFLLNSLQNIVSHLSLYWETGLGSFDWLIAIKITLFIVTVFCLLFAIFLLLKSLGAKTSSNQTGDNHVKTKSLIHYNSIQNISYIKFKEQILLETEEDKFEDVLSQIYINSRRCQEKFDKYNQAIRFIKKGIIFFVIYVTLLMV